MTADRYRRVRRAGWVAAVAALLAAGCDFLDPTNVTNPNTTAEDLARAAEPTNALLPGVRAQMARAVSSVVTISEIVSDNFEIAFTNITGDLNDPYLVSPDGGTYNGFGGSYWNLQELRALADFVIDTIAPQDAAATSAQLAEAHYYRGMAFLMQGESFVGVPTGPDLAPTMSAGLVELAIQDFDAALGLGASSERQVALVAALARAHRNLGNRAQAVQFATQALGLDADFVVLQQYGAGEIENPVFGDDRTREPLPRLDFLDPKYTSRDAAIPLAKAEEMHLILAEAAMADGDYGSASGHIAAAVALAKDRPRGEVNDRDQRLNPDLTVRPRNSEVRVRAEAGAPLRAGLVLDRPGVVEVPTISGTSLDADSVASLTDAFALRHALWLARQEILFLEGRRLHDLGVLMPISAREIDASPALQRGGPATEVQVPSYIPEGVIDDFSPRSPYANPSNGEELVTTEITIEIDMNRVLAEQRVSKFGTLP